MRDVRHTNNTVAAEAAVTDHPSGKKYLPALTIAALVPVVVSYLAPAKKNPLGHDNGAKGDEAEATNEERLENYAQGKYDEWTMPGDHKEGWTLSS
jgi:hypothetical protein